jgi:hypothetical protein
MMTKWLPETENTLPPNASHQVWQLNSTNISQFFEHYRCFRIFYEKEEAYFIKLVLAFEQL